MVNCLITIIFICYKDVGEVGCKKVESDQCKNVSVNEEFCHSSMYLSIQLIVEMFNL